MRKHQSHPVLFSDGAGKAFVMKQRIPFLNGFPMFVTNDVSPVIFVPMNGVLFRSRDRKQHILTDLPAAVVIIDFFNDAEGVPKDQALSGLPCHLEWLYHTKGVDVHLSARFIPKGKLSKKAQKELNRQRRVIWEFSPVTKTVDSKKIYNRKKKAHDRYDDNQYGMGIFIPVCFQGALAASSLLSRMKL